MNKYIVSIQEVHVVEVEVEAHSKNEARARANEKLAVCDVDFDSLTYSHTMEPETWEVSPLTGKLK